MLEDLPLPSELEHISTGAAALLLQSPPACLMRIVAERRATNQQQQQSLEDRKWSSALHLFSHFLKYCTCTSIN